MKSKTLETSLEPGAVQTSTFKKSYLLGASSMGSAGFPWLAFTTALSRYGPVKSKHFPLR